jgi:hypothetical protein
LRLTFLSDKADEEEVPFELMDMGDPRGEEQYHPVAAYDQAALRRFISSQLACKHTDEC